MHGIFFFLPLPARRSRSYRSLRRSWTIRIPAHRPAVEAITHATLCDKKVTSVKLSDPKKPTSTPVHAISLLPPRKRRGHLCVPLEEVCTRSFLRLTQ